MTKRKEKETGMNKATQTGPRHFWEPTISLMRGTSAQTVPACLSPLLLMLGTCSQTGHMVQLHRIMEWFWLEEPQRSTHFTPCHGKGHFLLSQVPPSPVQPGLGCFQG